MDMGQRGLPVIDVVWLSYHDETPARGYWDQQIIEAILPPGVRHHNGFETLRDLASGTLRARVIKL